MSPGHMVPLRAETFQNFQEQKPNQQCLSFPSNRKSQWRYHSMTEDGSSCALKGVLIPTGVSAIANKIQGYRDNTIADRTLTSTAPKYL